MIVLYKHFIFILIMLLSISILFGCRQSNENTSPNNTNSSSQTQKESITIEKDSKIKDELIKDSIEKFYDAIETQNSELFKQIADKEGIVFIRTFTSGFGTKGEEISETIDPSKLPSDLTFNFVENELPVSLKIEFENKNKNFSKMKLLKTKEKIEWDVLIKPEILNVLGELIETNNELGEETRVYILADGSFCLAQFAGSDMQYSRWAVFKKVGESYALKIIAIIN